MPSCIRLTFLYYVVLTKGDSSATDRGPAHIVNPTAHSRSKSRITSDVRTQPFRVMRDNRGRARSSVALIEDDYSIGLDNVATEVLSVEVRSPKTLTYNIK